MRIFAMTGKMDIFTDSKIGQPAREKGGEPQNTRKAETQKLENNFKHGKTHGFTHSCLFFVFL